MKKCMRWRSALLTALLLVSSGVHAYQDALHQQLTFLSAKQLSRCDAFWSEQLPSTAAPLLMPASRLSALDMRYVVRANVARSKGNFFGRMFRWNYFDVSQDGSEAFLGMFDTRFNARFSDLNAQILNAPKQRERQVAFGEVLSYLQDVSTPSRVVPVFTGRWWAFSLQDRLDRYPVDEPRVEASLDALCEEVASQFAQLSEDSVAHTLKKLLNDSAVKTMAAVTDDIAGMPAQWTVFWQPSAKDPGGDFGDYGPAGNNFGSRVDFRCATEEDPKMRCLLLENDPLYQEFAFSRHMQAVRSTMLAMLLVQRHARL